jgi:predicted ribosome quality control (RQC) complex YloA/Tae2 family protein
VDELREGVAFTIKDREWDSDKIVTDFNRLVRACGNLVIVNGENQVVQLAHVSFRPRAICND